MHTYLYGIVAGPVKLLLESNFRNAIVGICYQRSQKLIFGNNRVYLEVAGRFSNIFSTLLNRTKNKNNFKYKLGITSIIYT